MNSPEGISLAEGNSESFSWSLGYVFSRFISLRYISTMGGMYYKKNVGTEEEG